MKHNPIPARCSRCHATGTIVEMGLCCKVKEWNGWWRKWKLLPHSTIEPYQHNRRPCHRECRPKGRR